MGCQVAAYSSSLAVLAWRRVLWQQAVLPSLAALP